MPGIKNFTTEVAVDKTMGEVIGHLARRGVTQISSLYGDDGEPVGIGFTMRTDYGIRNFELPVRVDGVLEALTRDPQVPKPRKNRAQAARTAWRIAKDWLEAQSALIDAGLATLDEVAMPFMVDRRGQSAYSIMRTSALKELET